MTGCFLYGVMGRPKPLSILIKFNFISCKKNFDLIQTDGFDVFISLSFLKPFCFLFVSTSFFIFKYFFMICFMSRSHGVVDFVSLYFLNALFIDF